MDLRKITDSDDTLLAEEFDPNQPNRWKVYNDYAPHNDPHYPFFLDLFEENEAVVRSYAERRFLAYSNYKNSENYVQNIQRYQH